MNTRVLLQGFLISIFLILNTMSAETIDIVNLINLIYVGCKAKTVVMFQYYNSSRMCENQNAIWKQLEQPKILLTLRSEKADLISKFNSKILAVVAMDDNWQWSSEQWLHLESTIKRRSNMDVILLTNNMSLTDVAVRREFLTLCWHKGFARILMTSFENPHALYAMHRFPHVTIRPTSVALYLHERGKKLNCQGSRLRVSVGNNPPHALVYHNNNTGELVYRGTGPRIIQLFAKHFNFTIEWVLMPNFNIYALSECAKSIIQKRIDVCADYLPLNRTLYTVVKPIELVPLLMAVPFAQTKAKYKYLVLPFQQKLWLAISASFLYITFMLSLNNRYRCGLWNVGDHTFTSFGIFLAVPYRIPPWQGIEKYIVGAMLSAVGFIICNSYAAFLSSIVTTNVYESQIKSLQDLKQRGVTVLLNDMDTDVLDAFNVFHQISDNYEKIDTSTHFSIRKSLNPKHAYVGIETKIEFFLYQQKYLHRPILCKLKGYFGAIYGGIPMQLHWPLEEAFSHLYTSVLEEGILNYIIDQTLENSIEVGIIKFFKTKYPEVTPLNITFFYIPAMLIAVGHLSGLMCFVAEILFKIVKK